MPRKKKKKTVTIVEDKMIDIESYARAYVDDALGVAGGSALLSDEEYENTVIKVMSVFSDLAEVQKRSKNDY